MGVGVLGAGGERWRRSETEWQEGEAPRLCDIGSAILHTYILMQQTARNLRASRCTKSSTAASDSETCRVHLLALSLVSTSTPVGDRPLRARPCAKHRRKSADAPRSAPSNMLVHPWNDGQLLLQLPQPRPAAARASSRAAAPAMLPIGCRVLISIKVHHGFA